MNMPAFSNPFRPGAGHPPPYLAGRQEEQIEFQQLLTPPPILKNMVLTGLRGIGKTALLESLRPLVRERQWLWVGGELSEAANASEEALATRICTDLALITSEMVVDSAQATPMGFTGESQPSAITLDYATLRSVYDSTPGLATDKLKAVLTLTWQIAQKTGVQGIVFSFDEAQNLLDNPDKGEFPLSLLLDTFQSLQRQNLSIILVLTGLPTLPTQIVTARTYAERMFQIVSLKYLSAAESEEAIRRPIADASCPVQLSDESVQGIVEMSAGYPYFIQFICREVYDAFSQRQDNGLPMSVPYESIKQKLYGDFFAGRWNKATNRQRELLQIIAQLELCNEEFTIQQITQTSQSRPKPYSPGHISQMLSTLAERGWLFKNRHGRYTFALPLLQRFIAQQTADDPTWAAEQSNGN